MGSNSIVKIRKKMKKFLIENWKTITLTLLGLIFVYLLVRVFTPTTDMSELNKYKLDQIDSKINEIKKQQKDLKDSIGLYRLKIKEIDTKVSKIKLERNEINKFYTIKETKIKKTNNREIDSLLKKRYNF